VYKGPEKSRGVHVQRFREQLPRRELLPGEQVV
jgi:hypothetical protein